MDKNCKTIIFGLCLVLILFVLRLYNLTLIPVFCDEAIYIRWSQVMRVEPTLRFLPLSDGKQPLFMWLTIPLLKIFSDPLFAGRFLSVLAGFLSLVGIFPLTLRLFKLPKIAFLSALFYTIVPYTFFFDRLSLVDSLLSALGVWTFYLGILLVEHQRLDLAMITGMVLGAALITKSPAIFFAILLPLTILPVDKKWRPSNVVKTLGLFFIVYFFAFVIFNLLRLGPNFQMIALRNKDYVYSLREILSHPFDPLKPHLRDLAEWLPNLFTWPIFLLAIWGLIWLWMKRKKWREASFLFLLAGVPLLTQSIFAKVFIPRYLLFTVWPLVILAAFGFNLLLERLRQKIYLAIFLLILILIPALYYDWQLLFDPEKAPLPRRMRYGYLEEWTAGQGIREIAEFVKEKARTTRVLVGTEGFFGTLPDGLQIYLEKVPQVTIIGVGYPISSVPESLINSLVDNEVYLVVNQSRLQIPPDKYGLKLVREYPKAVNPEGKQDKLLLFELKKEFWQKR